MFTLSLRRATSNSQLLKRSLQALYSTSLEPLRKDSSEDYQDKEIKKFDRLTNIVKRTRTRKPQREPFVKNFLVGHFDKEMLTFPELDLEEFRNLEKNVEGLRQALHQRHMTSAKSLADKQFRQNLVDYKALGLQTSQFLDGRECCPMELMAFLDTLSEHPLRESLLHNDLLGAEILNRFADDSIKKKYLAPIVTGESVSAFAFNELGLSDVTQMKTEAKLTEDKKYWILNGTKAFVINGLSANTLVVVAVTEAALLDNEPVASVSVFVVDKESKGVSWRKLEGTDLDLADISFDNVQVPAENLIGPLHKGEEVIKPVMRDFRLSCGPACNAISKQLIVNLHKAFVKLSTPEYDYLATDGVRAKLGELLTDYYAAESVTYLTAGLQDWYENQDLDIECSVVKVFTSEAALRISTTCLDQIGLPATLHDHWARKGHDDILNYLTLHETNDNQRLLIALSGLQYAGIKGHQTVKKLRNPWSYANFMIKRLYTDRDQLSDNPKLDFGLIESLHPTCEVASKQLEYCVKRLQFATESLLTKHGLEIVNRHFDLRTLANVMIDCYVMSAVLARASRSYCIGLQFADYEIVLATVFCDRAWTRVRQNLSYIFDYDHKRHDVNLVAAGKRMAESKGYFLTSPLTRFF